MWNLYWLSQFQARAGNMVVQGINGMWGVLLPAAGLLDPPYGRNKNWELSKDPVFGQYKKQNWRKESTAIYVELEFICFLGTKHN